MNDKTIFHDSVVIVDPEVGAFTYTNSNYHSPECCFCPFSAHRLCIAHICETENIGKDLHLVEIKETIYIQGVSELPEEELKDG